MSLARVAAEDHGKLGGTVHKQQRRGAFGHMTTKLLHLSCHDRRRWALRLRICSRRVRGRRSNEEQRRDCVHALALAFAGGGILLM